MNNSIVLGLGFGDEGKGLVTDYLCSTSPNPFVVRFSGGHQVGHTVVTDELRHIFSNFGSGTLRNAPTYWTKFCTVEPIGLMNELEILLRKKVNPLIYIDEQCPITTTLDLFGNRHLEKENKHGSVGVGFGETIGREENHYSLKFLDLFYPKILNERIKLIADYYVNKFEKSQLIIWDEKGFKEKFHDFKVSCKDILNFSKYIKRTSGFPDESFAKYKESKSFIFEGSQGLLLDQRNGFFPNVTRSNTGIENVKQLTPYSGSLVPYFVTRAYQTRHGNGFMTNEDIPHKIKENPVETNKDHTYQGKFRRSLLDVSLLEYALRKHEFIDLSISNLVITCLDHIENEYRFTYKDAIIVCRDEAEFVNKVSTILNFKNVYISKSDNSKNLIKYNQK